MMNTEQDYKVHMILTYVVSMTLWIAVLNFKIFLTQEKHDFQQLQTTHLNNHYKACLRPNPVPTLHNKDTASQFAHL